MVLARACGSEHGIATPYGPGDHLGAAIRQFTCDFREKAVITNHHSDLSEPGLEDRVLVSRRNPSFNLAAWQGHLSVLSFDAAIGEWDNFGRGKLDYEFYSLTVAHNGFYGTFGTFENDFDGNYYEAGYGGTLEAGGKPLLDYGVALIYSDSTLLGGDSDYNLVLTLSKSFDL